MVDSYADYPEMSSGEIAQKVIEAIENDKYDFVTLNFPNADMVGHTGDLPAVIQAVEFLDGQIGKIAECVLKKGGHLIITADHGNADDMFDFNSDQPNTFHTKNPVPFVLISEKYKNRKLKDGGILSNIAPTILEIMEVPKPSLMEQESLLS
jgi:2,3-bisphosphoglycerate-independent phosphoglycerate mutase